MENVGTEKLPWVRGKPMDWLNGPAGLVASRTFGEFVVSVSVPLLGGAAAKLMD